MGRKNTRLNLNGRLFFTSSTVMMVPKKLPGCLVLTTARFVSGQNTGRYVERMVSPFPPKDIPLLSRNLCCFGCGIIIALPAKKRQQNSTLQPPVPSTDGRGFTAKVVLLLFAISPEDALQCQGRKNIRLQLLIPSSVA